MRRRLSYANVTATLALVFAMSGGALAAKHYLINSTSQINPKVLKKLVGKTGKTGPAGAPGATGREGPQGKEGIQGKEGKTGLKGEPGTAIAYADYAAGGTIQANTVPSNLSEANITNPEPGVYCLKEIGFSSNTAMVSADNSFAADETIVSVVVTPKTNLSPCSTGETVRVRTFNVTNKKLENEPFNIWFS